MKTNWTTANIPSQVGRRALITGSNSGIGFETALARKGAEVILPARTQANDEFGARLLLGHGRRESQGRRTCR